MGYLHIDNLYINQDILMFKECYAMEKIHGTSANIMFKKHNKNTVSFFSGGEKHEKFVKLFDKDRLYEKLKYLETDVIIYGEAYGGKQQGMRHTYGNDLKFIAFDVKINDNWLNVPDAEKFCKELELEFVYYTKIKTDINIIDKEKSKPSVQAVRNGIGEPKTKEGLVLRPLIELKKNNGSRIISKHKNDEFKETSTSRKVIDPEKLKILENAKEIANEWCTHMRLIHVLDKIKISDIKDMRKLISGMQEDIKREGNNEIKWSVAVEKEIARQTSILFKEKLKNELYIND